ncbi:alpha/beta hydrolase [Streptomyces sp. NPDC052069]|uniref:alpha/beta hydrolase n=1 Tax=Streptomyces sp. NPDC052069 TaxID=3154650 RepID=UPI003422DCB9
MVGCDTRGAFGSPRGAYEIFNRAASEKKELFVVPGSTHYSLYDQPKYVDQAFERGFAPFLQDNLWRARAARAAGIFRPHRWADDRTG